MEPTGDDQLSTTKPSFKYGPSAVRDIHYVTGIREPYVRVKQRKNGQYVVIERLPVHHRSRNYGLPTFTHTLVESDVRLNSLKPDWKPTSKIRDADRKDDSALFLPPIDLGWRKKVQATVGSLENVRHEPGGGHKPIPRRSVSWASRAKVGSLDNVHYKSPRTVATSQSDPLTSNRQLSSTFQASPRYGALANLGSLGSSLHYTPAGAEVMMKPRHYEHVRSLVGSLENIGYVPAGGDVTVKSQLPKWKAESKVGSLDNVSHVAGGGDVAITNERLNWQTRSKIGSLENVSHKPGGGQARIQRNKVKWLGRSRVGSLANIHHKPGGGVVNITNNRVKWVAQAKVDTKPPRRKSSPASLDFLDSY